MRLILVLACSATLAACSEPLRPITDGEVLALGDSVIEWNIEDNRSIADFIGLSTGLRAVNGAVGGSTLLATDPEAIMSRYEDRGWQWVVLAGGANDLGECGCGDCSATVDRIINTELDDGAMVELVDRARTDGARVIVLGYYTLPPGTEFDGCEDDASDLESRYMALAEARDDVWFYDMSEVMNPIDTPEFYDDDNTHPSQAGSEAIGRGIGALINSL